MASYRELEQEEEGLVLGQHNRASSPSPSSPLSFSTNESTPLLQTPVPDLTKKNYTIIDVVEIQNPRITYTTRARADTIATSSSDTAVNDDAEQEQYNSSLLEARRKRLKPKIIPLCLGAMFLLELSVALSVPPTNAVEESIICRNLHPDVVSSKFANNTTTSSIMLSENPVCKEEDVQSYLAMLQGWQATFDCIPSILMTVPFGILSDKWGRRPVLSLAMSGAMLQMFALATIRMYCPGGPLALVVRCWLAYIQVTVFLPNIFPIWTVWLTSSFLL